jgi:sugar phosphate isomerase/epimerase
MRCRKLGIELIVWGSGGARRIPEGFDKIIARNQFVEIARRVSILAKKYKITLALENLNATETNFITTVSEALEIVKHVNHSNFKLCADIYHMLKENEPAVHIEAAKGYLVHCDIAEKENRTPPGVMGDDFSAYLKALKNIEYKGKIIMECRWSNLNEQAEPARISLQKQIQHVWNK